MDAASKNFQVQLMGDEFFSFSWRMDINTDVLPIHGIYANCSALDHKQIQEMGICSYFGTASTFSYNYKVILWTV